ncbi:hypothetical protein vseg_007479 [Gypsophila vaccaria]
MWGTSPQFRSVVLDNWDRDIQGSKMFTLCKRLKLLKPALKQLNKERFSDIEQTCDVLESKVLSLQKDIGVQPTQKLIEEEYRLLQELKELTEAKRSFLEQKSKCHWIQQGDANAAYFHGLIKARRVRNKVCIVEDMKGNVCTSPNTI